VHRFDVVAFGHQVFGQQLAELGIVVDDEQMARQGVTVVLDGDRTRTVRARRGRKASIGRRAAPDVKNLSSVPRGPTNLNGEDKTNHPRRTRAEAK
jgi:hypothetical protein